MEALHFRNRCLLAKTIDISHLFALYILDICKKKNTNSCCNVLLEQGFENTPPSEVKRDCEILYELLL